ncbi:hypothetical protein E2P81_ATG09632 [Venturia nashicola]|uniref:Uncharacterized protein n=1 Tax=Venturia nashicola TaxID=86259 RepID=A0A4Z1P0I4_9PEZI|nr:hypothetical protein E6O75_ATG09843 [Venturia nashicola]TLD25975.1 hypothetical protein E2P81_ATG09632 [Venturia nashicola]
MEEARTGCASLPNVDEDDSLRFRRCAYRSDYATPPFGAIEEVVEANHLSGKMSPWDTWSWGNGWSLGSAPERKADKADEMPEAVSEDKIPVVAEPVQHRLPPSLGKRVNKALGYNSSTDAVHFGISRLQRAFSDLCYCPNLPRQPPLNSYKIVKNTSKVENCTPVFSAHTRLYVFADKYGIETLKSLALDKLHETLDGYTFVASKYEDIVESVRFSCPNDNTPDDANDRSSDLVLQFITAQQEKEGKSEAFLSLLEEGGPPVRDFWVSVLKSLLK